MSTVACERCKLTFDGPEGEISLARCKDAECPMKKNKRGIVVPALIAIGATALTVAGAAAGLSWLGEKPTLLEESEKKRAIEAKARVEAEAEAKRVAATMAQPAPDGGTGIPAPRPEIATAAKRPVVTGPPPPINPAAAARVTTFECGGRMSAGRSLVCSDVGLAVSDYNLSLLYDSVMVTSGRRGDVRRSQIGWLSQLDRIGNDKPGVSAHYRRRFDELSRIQAGVK
jgi:hypothetical protein